MIPQPIRLAIGVSLTVTCAERLSPQLARWFPLAGDDFLRAAIFVLLAVALIEIYEATRVRH